MSAHGRKRFAIRDSRFMVQEVWIWIATWGWAVIISIAILVGIIACSTVASMSVVIAFSLYLAAVVHALSHGMVRHQVNRRPGIEQHITFTVTGNGAVAETVKDHIDRQYPPPAYHCVDRQFVDGVANRWVDAP